MLTFEEFKATQETVTPEMGADRIQIEMDHLGADCVAVHLFKDHLYAEEKSDGTFWTIVERSEFEETTIEAIAFRLYLHFYVTECATDHTESDLLSVIKHCNEAFKNGGQTIGDAYDILRIYEWAQEKIRTFDFKETKSIHGFRLTNMSDHKFAAFVREHKLTFAHVMNSTIWTDSNGVTHAVVIYDNVNSTRAIHVKEMGK